MEKRCVQVVRMRMPFRQRKKFAIVVQAAAIITTGFVVKTIRLAKKGVKIAAVHGSITNVPICRICNNA